MKIKNKIYVLGIILLIGFIVNSCKDDENDPKECQCPEGTIHFIGDTMKCVSEINCNCEHGNFEGKRASNGIAITNRDNVTNFNDMVDEVNRALTGYVTENDTYYLSETQKEYIKNNIKEIKITHRNNISNAVFVINSVLTVFDINYYIEIMITLLIWCETDGIE